MRFTIWGHIKRLSMQRTESEDGYVEEAGTHTKRQQRRRKGGKERNMDEQQIELVR